MTAFQQQLAGILAILALAGAAVKYGRDAATAEHTSAELTRRLEALEEVTYSEHPEWAARLYFATGEKGTKK